MSSFVGKSKEETLDLIIDYLNSQYDLAERLSTSRESYDINSWPFYQADLIGQKRLIKKLIDHINRNRKEKNDNRED